MQTFVTETKATETKKLQSRRNLFGLGITSLIAACSGAAGDGGGAGDDNGGGPGDPALLPFKAAKAEKPEKIAESTDSGYTAEIETDTDFMGKTDGLYAQITQGSTPTFLKLSNEAGDKANENRAGIYKLTGAYDLVLSARNIDNKKGAIFIYWDVANIATSKYLEIKGNTEDDRIGVNPPEFFQLGGATEGGYDMVFASNLVSNNKGAIYILWDVAQYKNEDHTVNLVRSDGAGDAAHGLLVIEGTSAIQFIGINAPDFLQIGGVAGEKKLDMVIRSQDIDKTLDSAGANTGAIYVLWDIQSYYTMDKTTRYFTLADSFLRHDQGATAGSLAIYGAKSGDLIGTHAPEFFQIGGTANNYDMVIRSHEVGAQEGAIYVLWDVVDYYQDVTDRMLKNKRIDLGEANAEAGNYATAGLLTIKGAIAEDQIGIHETEFLQLGKENDKYDLIIRSEHVDKSATEVNTGAIYVLWDVADYANQNVSIDLATANASSGLLTIYGAADSMLGSSNVLYRADSEDSDVDGDGTNDLVFKDKDYTYVLFGDKIADTGDDDKVDSKTIDLGQIQVNANGFFGDAVDTELGYRFAGSKDFAAVKTDFPSPTATDVGLSDADADLGVWDIA